MLNMSGIERCETFEELRKEITVKAFEEAFTVPDSRLCIDWCDKYHNGGYYLKQSTGKEPILVFLINWEFEICFVRNNEVIWEPISHEYVMKLTGVEKSNSKKE